MTIYEEKADEQDEQYDGGSGGVDDDGDEDVNDVNVIYVGYVKSGGKSGNPDRLPEEQAKVLMTLKDAINTMLGNRGNAEELAFEIEEVLKQKQA